jgi:predicted transposase/invertase (TIGR01784 family)
MSELTNPHDRFFKELFARPETAAEFLSSYLPLKIAGVLDLTALEPVRDSFVDAELQEHLSDLLYRVRLKQGGRVCWS